MGPSEVWALDRRGLAELLRSGHPIDAEALVGADYRGVSLGLPGFVERLTWKVFSKVFRRGPSGGVIGHNVRLEQRGLEGPMVPVLAHGKPVTFGPYRVTQISLRDPFRCRNGLLLDYGAEHPSWHPLARVRDPIVAVNAGDTSLLLGATYVELGWLRARTPSFFTLERA